MKLFISCLVVITIVVSLVLFSSGRSSPFVHIRNQSGQEVVMRATTNDNTKGLGALAPGAERSFRVRDESTVLFTVVFPDGTAIDTQEKYFTSGLKVEMVISRDGVELWSE